MSKQIYKEVEFWNWCPKCKHKDVDEVKDPCNECMESFFNVETGKPVNFEEGKNE